MQQYKKKKPSIRFRIRATQISYWSDSGLLILKKTYRNSKGQWSHNNKIQMNLIEFFEIMKVEKMMLDELKKQEIL